MEDRRSRKKKIELAKCWSIGTPVTVTKDNGEHVDTFTRSAPWLLGGHTWVIMVAGIAGSYALERVNAQEQHHAANPQS